MENWRKWLGAMGVKKDFPADGVSPAGPELYDIHAGGATNGQLPLLNPPDEIPQGSAIKDRPALSIDPPRIDYAPGEYDIGMALDALEKNRQSIEKSDSHPRWVGSMENREEMVSKLKEKWNVQFRELTHLEGAPTMSKDEWDRHLNRMNDFREVLAHSDTVDIDLFHINKELNDMNKELKTLKDKNKQKET